MAKDSLYPALISKDALLDLKTVPSLTHLIPRSTLEPMLVHRAEQSERVSEIPLEGSPQSRSLRNDI